MAIPALALCPACGRPAPKLEESGLALFGTPRVARLLHWRCRHCERVWNHPATRSDPPLTPGDDSPEWLGPNSAR